MRSQKNPRLRWASLPLSVAVIVLWAQPAAAYIDPGSGSYILQLLVGGFIAAAATIGTFWSRIRSFFSRSERDER